jgi:hypothetical protein
MNSKHTIARTVGILALLGLGLGASGTLQDAHAGAGGLPHIEATLLAHDISHCTKQGNTESCYTTTETSIQVSGTQFTPGGSLRVEIEDAQTLAVYYNQTLQAGTHGGFSVDTGHRYCTQHGRLVRAYDLTLHSYSNTVTIQPCGTL